MQNVYLAIVLAPLIGAIIAGLFKVSRTVAHSVTIGAVGLSFILSVVVFWDIVIAGNGPFNETLYTWLIAGNIHFGIGFLVDSLTALMMVVVTFVSLMVHIYTIGYMHDDPGYQRFFSYISLFTFAMLTLVMSNNFLQLFFGWEAVGLVSYLLIGFWYTRESAIYANLKAFLVNRVGDFGFALGIAAVLMTFNSLNYTEVFYAAQNGQMTQETIEIFSGTEWSMMTVICILLFIGAMGKSAQVPLHVWLPDSMEGPTPISALIHAATMVTAGIFMVARMSPLFELSATALSFVLIIGATTAFFMGLLGLVQNDIKRVVAYSTLSQLGYMTVALGASAYAAGMFHLMTHAFFKALLFLGAGSVIIAMHHEQDMRKMGGLKKYLPITYWTALIGSLALIGFPGFSGFFSKDAIIEAVHHAYEAERFGAGYAYYAVVLGVFITALYTFRMFYLTFHGKERMDEHTREHLHEPPRVVTWPLIALAVPSVIVGMIAINPLLFGTYFQEAIFVESIHNPFAEHASHGFFLDILYFIGHALMQPPVWLAFFGWLTAFTLYLKRPEWLELIKARTGVVYTIIVDKLLVEKYYFDRFNDWFFAGGSRKLGGGLWQFGDVKLIDDFIVNGSAKSVAWFSGRLRHIQTGYLYHYAFAMILGFAVLLGAFVIYPLYF
jgi:NADH-quinone oxidoreductase subunit L